MATGKMNLGVCMCVCMCAHTEYFFLKPELLWSPNSCPTFINANQEEFHFIKLTKANGEKA